MKLEKNKKYKIEELKLFPEWELENRGDDFSIELKPAGKCYHDEGVLVTQQILDSWTITEVRPKLKTGYYTTERLKDKVVYRVVASEDGEVDAWVALDLIYPMPHPCKTIGQKVKVDFLIEKGLIPCKVKIELDK